MKELIEIIAKALVDEPEKVEVREVQKDNLLVIKLRVTPDDMGKVIGKQGRIAKSIRTVLKAAATKENDKVVLDIED